MVAEIATDIVPTFPELHVSVLPGNHGCLHFPQGPKLAQGNCKIDKLPNWLKVIANLQNWLKMGPIDFVKNASLAVIMFDLQ